MKLFENFIIKKGVLFYQPTELFPSSSQLGEEKGTHFPIILSAYYI